MAKSATVSLLALILASGMAFAQPAAETPKAAEPAKPEYVPQVGQEGKDVIWVPTPQALVDRMLDLAKPTSLDFVIDLGSGDGRTVITAARRGVDALGIEYNPDMVELSKRNAAKEGVEDRAKFVHGDIFATDFTKATVLAMYLLPTLNLKLRPTILDMKPGTRVVSNSFDMDDWRPDRALNADGEDCERYCQTYFWIVPAKVGGTWQLPQGTLTLEQKFQFVTGTLTTGKRTVKISDGRLRGAEISFVAGDRRYSGTVNGDTIEGTIEPVFRAARK